MPWWNNGIKEYCRDVCPPGCTKGRLKRETNIDLWAKSLSKEKLYKYYIEENHSSEETAKHFSFSKNQIIKLCKYYGISKRDLHIQAKPTITRTHEDYIKAGKKSRATQQQNWKNKTAEEKTKWSKKMRDSHLSGNYKTIKAAQNTEYHNSLSKEEIDQQNASRSQALKEFWNNLSEEEKWERINKQFNGGSGYKTANSKPNLAFMDLLKQHRIPFKREFRINKFSYDFLVNDNVLIEINPSATHNTTWSPFPNNKAYLDQKFHYNKTQAAIDNGYRCIHIWDWDDKSKIVTLLRPRGIVQARKCTVRLINKDEAKEFVNQYHLQGYAKSDIHIGLFNNNQLISVMTFGKPRYNKNYEYELVRYCSKDNITGGVQKLFKYFIREYNPKSIISYCDKSKFDGHVYLDLGFEYKSRSISKHWYNIKTQTHITDNLLRQRGFDQLLGKTYGCFGKGTNNDELMRRFGFVEIFDAGQDTYVYINIT